MDSYKRGEENRLSFSNIESFLSYEPYVAAIKSYFTWRVGGLEKIPPGGAILVMNHGLLPVDAFLLGWDVYHQYQRIPRGMTDHSVFKIPFLREFFLNLGVVDGTMENGQRLLEQGELLIIMPGGAKEAWKASRDRYQLKWNGRYGFVKLALRAGVPIVPIVCAGIDDLYFVANDGYRTSQAFFGKSWFPLSFFIGLGPLPFPVPLTCTVGDPIRFDFPPEAADDEETVRQLQADVRSTMARMLADALAESERDQQDVDSGGPAAPNPADHG